jgi:P4 family phage/plasmid primase-like protien
MPSDRQNTLSAGATPDPIPGGLGKGAAGGSPLLSCASEREAFMQRRARVADIVGDVEPLLRSGRNPAEVRAALVASGHRNDEVDEALQAVTDPETGTVPKIPEADGVPASADKLTTLCGQVAIAKQGGRNAALNRAAFSAGGLVRNGIVDAKHAQAELLRAAALCGLSLGDATPVIERALADGIEHGGDLRKLTSRFNGGAGGRPRMDPRKMACDFIDASRESFELRRWRGTWFEFVSGRGWREIAEDEIEARVLTFLAAHPEHAQHARLNAVREILGHLGTFTLCGLPEVIEMPSRLIRDAAGTWSGEPCPNVVAVRVDGQLVTLDLIEAAKHIAGLRPDLPAPGAADSSFFSLDWMPYRVEARHLTPVGVDLEQEAPLFSKYLEHALDPAEQAAVQRMIGLCLTDLTRFEVFWFFHGRSGREGKTVGLDILQALLGRCDAVACVDIATLADRFSCWPLAHAKVNLTGDSNAVEHGSLVKLEGLFKNLVSGGAFEYERKNEQKRSARCKARFIFAANSLPEFVDRSDAIWERLRVIDFPRQVPRDRRDPHLADKIIRQELPAVFAWAVAGLADVIASNACQDTRRGLDLKAELRQSCDHEAEFVSDAGLVRDPSGSLPTDELYREYRIWAGDNGYRPLGSAKFLGRLRHLLGAYMARDRDPQTGKQPRVLRGVRREAVPPVPPR